MVAEPHRRLITADEYHAMADAGILRPDERTELLNGEIVVMAAVGGAHVACVLRLGETFGREVRDRAIVSIQNPVRLGPHTEPEPDVALLVRRADYYASGLPQPGDVLLIIEVADTSLGYDRGTKLPQYAAAGIAESWLVALPADRIELHRNPVDGSYRDVTVVGRGAVIAPLAFPDLRLRVEDILGPAAAG